MKRTSVALSFHPSHPPCRTHSTAAISLILIAESAHGVSCGPPHLGFNLHRVLHCRHLVVVEGYFGAIRLYGLRIPAVALMGASISEEQMALLRRRCLNLRYVTVMLDGDEPGRDAAEKVAGVIANVGPVSSNYPMVRSLLGRGEG